MYVYDKHLYFKNTHFTCLYELNSKLLEQTVDFISENHSLFL